MKGIEALLGYVGRLLFLLLLSLCLLSSVSFVSGTEVLNELGDQFADRGGSEVYNNDQPVTAWIIPHSHCDVGWKETVDQYYTRNVSRILDQVVQALQRNPAR